MARAQNGAILITRAIANRKYRSWTPTSITVIRYLAIGLSLGFTLGYGVGWLHTWWPGGSSVSTARDAD